MAQPPRRRVVLWGTVMMLSLRYGSELPSVWPQPPEKRVFYRKRGLAVQSSASNAIPSSLREFYPVTAESFKRALRSNELRRKRTCSCVCAAKRRAVRRSLSCLAPCSSSSWREGAARCRHRLQRRKAGIFNCVSFPLQYLPGFYVWWKQMLKMWSTLDCCHDHALMIVLLRVYLCIAFKRWCNQAHPART